MLHEILLSLSGHPSPLLRPDLSAEASAAAGISPPERQLLSVAAHLSDVHIKLINSTARVSNSHPSAICRAVATAVKTIHLAAFQRKVLEVEEGILKQDPEYVGAYNIVPLTAVMGEFKQWIRRMDWLWDVVQFMSSTPPDSTHLCWGAKIIEKLRTELQSGYRDIEETAASLVKAAETTWLRQTSAWVFYGKLPAIGGDDFFIQQAQGDFATVPELVPLFVTPATASSILFIGKSINLIRTRNSTPSAMAGMQNVAARLQDINRLSFPINSVSLAKTVAGIRQSLSESTLQSILPLDKVVNMLSLLREFMLLGRGEFAMAVSQEADERIRNRWRRAGNLGHSDKDEGVQNVIVKDGEVAAVLARAWSSLVTLQGRQSDDDTLLDQARDLLRLHLVKSSPVPPSAGPGLDADSAALLAALPFNTTLFSVPVTLSIQLPSPLDMVISPSDLQIYSCVNAYLLSLRRAHIRLTDLWKLTSLRRHHPCPRGTSDYAIELRKRWSERSFSMRSSWTTASAAIFFLGETEAYLQTEIVSALWQGFHSWLTGNSPNTQHTITNNNHKNTHMHMHNASDIHNANDSSDQDDSHMSDANADADARQTFSSTSAAPCHDQQALATGHTLYLRTLAHRLLLTQKSFTAPLFTLLMHIDHLVTHTHRLHSIYTAMDLETDAGVMDSFTDLEAEQDQVTHQLRAVQAKVRHDIETVINALETLSNDAHFLAAWEGDALASSAAAEQEDDLLAPGQAYKPQRLGGLDRLLRKLDFGSWFGKRDDFVYPELE